jgi:hypothetical protein
MKMLAMDQFGLLMKQNTFERNNWVICVVCESDMQQYHICGVMVGVLTSNAGQTNNYKIGVCCFSSKYIFSYIMARTS